MKNKYCVFTLFFAIALTSLLLGQNAESLQEKRDRENREESRRFLDKMKNTPIDFWGKVVDENEQPVSGANVKFSIRVDPDPNVKPEEEILQTDDKGEFSIQGKKGHNLFISVSKEGYYTTRSKEKNGHRSNGDFFYLERDNPNILHPTKFPKKGDPIIFVLQKKGIPAALIKYEHIRFKMPKDGTPIEVSLAKGRVTSRGDLRVECWVDDQAKDERKRYDWHCRISVPNGGLIERTGELDFQAPENGYRASAENEMPKSGERWSDETEERYFVKLSDNRYARIKVTVYGRSEPYFVLYSFLNPQAGDRNLEYDKSKEIKNP